jgi:serine/threonine-protein kinase
MVGTPERIGDYRIERQLARNGACLEYHATHMVLPRRAVLKAMAPTTQPIAMSVLREACMLEALHHPGVVRVYESGLLPDRRPWFARELAEGVTVAGIMAPGAMDRVDVISLLRDIADILTHAHSRGVIHSNLRPERVLLTGKTRAFPVCITDWSEARAHDAEGVPQTPTGASRYYAAPEVALGDTLDDRADVFSLGVIAYRLLTGTLPFEGQVAVASDGTLQHVPTEVRCPEAPRELTGMVDQMLSPDRWDRPSGKEVHADLSWLAEVLAMPVASATGLVRIRKPRWTPSTQFGAADDGIEIGPLIADDDLDVES